MGFGRLGDPLTRREEEILLGLADGLMVTEIAAELHIAAETAKGHAQSLRQKLGAVSMGQAVAIVVAYHRGLLTPKVAA